ncbi:MAG TPA: putative glycoside hydrolase [Lachnospiraceae bacterium]|nr:putative glycoside hydrolase [Lachnospiraceae bacterium]
MAVNRHIESRGSKVTDWKGKDKEWKKEDKRQEGKQGFKQVASGILLIVTSVLLGAGAYYFIQKGMINNTQETISTANVEDYDKDNQSKVTNNDNDTKNPSSTDTNTSNTEKTEGVPTKEETPDSDDTNTDLAKSESITNAIEYDNTKDFPATDIASLVKVPACKAKGIYITGPKAGSDKYMKELIQLVDRTELNTMVIDIKNDLGEITYKMDNDTAKEIGATKNYIRDIEALVKELKEKDIYLVARIVAFKDPLLAENMKSLSIKNKDGSTFKDKSGLSWVNPYKKEVWDYLIDIAKQAVDLGFDEIQFDYIRFSTDSKMKQVDFGKEAKGKTKMEAITEFTKYAYEQLSPLGVYVSADVFGAIISSEVDADIVGQSYVDMAKYLDYICPMIYPSHYANGSYDIKNPDLEPYELIKKALEDSKSILEASGNQEHQAIVRPWLQDFTATWLDQYQKYDSDEVRAQIKAVYDSGYEEWILWNGSNNYTEGGLENTD